MADEVVEGERGEGVLADLMAKTPRRVFTGETIEVEEPEKEPGPEEKPPEEKPPEEEPGPEEKPPEGKAPEEEIPEGWEFKPKYKDHKEAEVGAREHQRFATEKAEEAKREREAREQAEQETEELRQKLAEKEKPPEKPPEEVKAADKAERKARIAQALKTIRELDEDDPDYDDRVAEAWADAGFGTAEMPGVDPKEIAKEAARLAREELKAEQAPKTEETAAETQARVRKEATEMAIKAGLDMEKGSADDLLFWGIVEKLLPEEYDTKPLKEQVDWVVNEVRKRQSKVVQMTEAEKEKARKAQARNAVLEKGTTRPPPKKPEKEEPYTLGSLRDEVIEERRIR